MNECTVEARASRLARASFFYGQLALLLLGLSGGLICGLAVQVGRSGLPGPSRAEISDFSRVALLLQGLAVLAALAAFVLGTLGLVTMRRCAGKVPGIWRAVAGLVTSTPTVLTLVLVYGAVLAPNGFSGSDG
jgi:hypothetical protein